MVKCGRLIERVSYQNLMTNRGNSLHIPWKWKGKCVRVPPRLLPEVYPSKAAKEEAESASNPELEEALRKAKEDKERKAKLRRKRGEEALQFNVVPGIKKMSFEGIYNRNFNKERQFMLNRIELDFLDILCQIKERYWEIFTLFPSFYHPTLVREFYASYEASQKHQKEIGPLRSRSCLEQVKVRKVEVDCNAKNINRAYFDEDDVDAIEYFAKLENPEDYYT
ncbi:hypothetical protein HAX54_046210 [Datura stramonium]|uniref:Uncharacterized protein n=1 Tax=Datura stramonium TaxID=4076 RepID=A0ABS8SR41_DATST|nr:hypothetical protein [Datura stramonium]